MTDHQRTEDDCDFHLCAIGASAGGLEALISFFGAVDPEIPVAYAVIQHLAPDFDSQMDKLLARHTPLPIRKMEDGQTIESGVIYLNMPGMETIASNGKFCLAASSEKNTVNLGIDRFFRSVAQDFGRLSIGVILSGTGSDGSRGIQEIADHGGLVLAQTPADARFDGMPRAAARSGACASQRKASSLPALINIYVTENLSPDKISSLDLPSDSDDEIARIERMLNDRFSIDFSCYKPSTILRRIERRQVASGKKSTDAYRSLLESDRDELTNLYYDLLIGVTSFFRDRESFGALDDYFAENEDAIHKRFRAWVPACATGEEAYSLAILLRERMLEAGIDAWPKVFATDVHEPALKAAGEGVYGRDKLENLQDEILERYFENLDDDNCRVVDDLRRAVVFARHNVIEDPPFTRMDLVTCRNLLIYFQPNTQEKVLALLHFSLVTRGILFLGNSETLSGLSDEFDVISSKHRLYRKRRPVRLLSHLRDQPNAAGRNSGRSIEGSLSGGGSTMPRYADAILQRFAPRALLVDEQLNLKHSFGGAQSFLNIPSGQTTTHLPDLLPKGLRASLIGALRQCQRTGKAVNYKNVPMSEDGEDRIDLHISSLLDVQGFDEWLLVELKETQSEPRRAEEMIDTLEGNQASAAYVSSLESDLLQARENLQATVEELETSNEELQATNEELMAANEELQGTNEELQSVNEELHSVNSEYHLKLDELIELTADMQLLLRVTKAGTIYLDDGLNIRQFSDRIGELLDLRDQDVGRPFLTFAKPLKSPAIEAALLGAINERRSSEIEVEIDDRMHLVRIVASEEDTKSNGCVLLFVDISAYHEQAIAARRLSEIVKQTQEAIISKSLDGTIASWNHGAEETLGYAADEVIGKSVFDLIPEELHDEEKEHLATIANGASVPMHETLRRHKSGDVISVSMSLSPIKNSAGETIGISSVANDMTALRSTESALRQTLRQREQFLALLSHELRNPLMAMNSAATILDAETASPEAQKKAVSSIARQVEQIGSLLDDMLNASRMRRDRVELTLKYIDLRQTADAVLDTVAPSARKRGVTIESNVADDPIWIKGDAARLRQLQVNLLMNAVRYSEKGDVVTYEIEQESDRAIIRVVDQGIGMTGEVIERIFDPFYQADQEGKEGMGLGLALAKGIVDGHDGNIDATSEGLGKGSTFEVSLSVVAEADVEAATEDDDTASIPRPRSILLIDDDDDGREALALLLRHRGHVVREVDCGVGGVAAVDDNDFDVAIVDLGLPDISGLEVARQIGRQLGQDKPKLIALTGFGQTKDLAATTAAGFDAHLVKPIRIDIIDREIGKV